MKRSSKMVGQSGIMLLNNIVRVTSINNQRY